MQFRRRLKPQVNVNLVPMIDVVFQLVIFFMVSSTFILTPGISIIFPASTTSEPVVMSKLVVTVVSRDEVYFNKEKYGIRELDEKLSSITDEERSDIKTVVLEGDRGIPYSLLIEILDLLRRNGFKGINLRTREIRG